MLKQLNQKLSFVQHFKLFNALAFAERDTVVDFDHVPGFAASPTGVHEAEMDIDDWLVDFEAATVVRNRNYDVSSCHQNLPIDLRFQRGARVHPSQIAATRTQITQHDVAETVVHVNLQRERERWL